MAPSMHHSPGARRKLAELHPPCRGSREAAVSAVAKLQTGSHEPGREGEREGGEGRLHETGKYAVQYDAVQSLSEPAKVPQLRPIFRRCRCRYR